MARRLEKHGFTVYAGVLYPEGEGARSLKGLKSERMHVLPMDVTSDNQVKLAVTEVRTLANDKGER